MNFSDTNLVGSIIRRRKLSVGGGVRVTYVCDHSVVFDDSVSGERRLGGKSNGERHN